MRKTDSLIINVLLAIFLVLIPFSAKAQMKEGNGHDSEHGQASGHESEHGQASGHGSGHGHSKKGTMNEKKMHSEHDGTKTGHDHQATSLPKKMPKHLDVALAKYSEDAKFFIGITSKLKPVAINKIHSWVLQIRKPDGERISDAKIHVSGGMPMHGHGLPTSPRVTEYLNDGKYLIEGVRFNMTGWWELKFMVKSGHHKDKVTFNIILK